MSTKKIIQSASAGASPSGKPPAYPAAAGIEHVQAFRNPDRATEKLPMAPGSLHWDNGLSLRQDRRECAPDHSHKADDDAVLEPARIMSDVMLCRVHSSRSQPRNRRRLDVPGAMILVVEKTARGKVRTEISASVVSAPAVLNLKFVVACNARG